MLSTAPTVLERAFALAKSGAFKGKGEIAKALWREGYRSDDLAHLVGASISRQLRELCAHHRSRLDAQPDARPTTNPPSSIGAN